MSQSLIIKVTLVAGVFFAASSQPLIAARPATPLGDVVEATYFPSMSVGALGGTQTPPEIASAPSASPSSSSEWKRRPSGMAVQGATAVFLGLAAPDIDPAIITTIAGNLYGIFHTQGPVRLALMGTLLYQLSTNEHTAQLINRVVKGVTPEPVYAAWNRGVSLFKTLYPVHQELIRVVNGQEESVSLVKMAKVDLQNIQSDSEEETSTSL